MTGEGIELRVTGAEQFTALSKRLKQAGQVELRKELNAAVRSVARPLAEQARTAILGWESTTTGFTGGRQTRAAHEWLKGKHQDAKSAERARKRSGLRATIARAIQVKIRTSGYSAGVTIRVDGTKLPEDQRALPARIDAGKWRHPVWGDRESWVTQSGRLGWFTETLARGAEPVRRKIIAAMDGIAARIDR